MKKSMHLLLVVALALPLAGCDFLDRLLSVNLFDSELTLSVAEVSEMTVEELQEEARSPDFYDLLESDPAIEDEVLDEADDTIADPASTTTEVQDAAILGAHVEIYTSPAGDLIDNLVDNLVVLSDPPVDGFGDPDIAAILELLVPPSVMVGGVIQEAAFLDMIDSLLDAADYFEVLGMELAGGGYDTDYANPGQIAQNALVAALVAAIDMPLTYDDDGDPLTNPPSMSNYLFDLLTGEPVDAPVDYSFPSLDPVDPEYDESLHNIFLAAGLDPADFGL